MPGLFSFAVATVLHAFPLRATVDFVRREENLGRLGTSFWRDIVVVFRTIDEVAEIRKTVAQLMGV